MARQFGHEGIAELSDLIVGFALGIKVGSTLFVLFEFVRYVCGFEEERRGEER